MNGSLWDVPMRSTVFCVCSHVNLTLPFSVQTSPKLRPPATQVRSESLRPVQASLHSFHECWDDWHRENRCPSNCSILFFTPFRPAELQRVGGEHVDTLSGQPEELAAPLQQRSRAADRGQPVSGAGEEGWHFGVPLHPQRSPVDHSGQGLGTGPVHGGHLTG